MLIGDTSVEGLQQYLDILLGKGARDGENRFWILPIERSRNLCEPSRAVGIQQSDPGVIAAVAYEHTRCYKEILDSTIDRYPRGSQQGDCVKGRQVGDVYSQ